MAGSAPATSRYATSRGFFKIVDRKKDMITGLRLQRLPERDRRRGGPASQGAGVAAVGVPNPVSGEQVKIFVVRKMQSWRKGGDIAHCRKHLTAYKVPKLVEFRDELPKTNVGKILRRVLRDEEIAK